MKQLRCKIYRMLKKDPKWLFSHPFVAHYHGDDMARNMYFCLSFTDTNNRIFFGWYFGLCVADYYTIDLTCLYNMISSKSINEYYDRNYRGWIQQGLINMATDL